MLNFTNVTIFIFCFWVTLAFQKSTRLHRKKITIFNHNWKASWLRKLVYSFGSVFMSSVFLPPALLSDQPDLCAPSVSSPHCARPMQHLCEHLLQSKPQNFFIAAELSWGLWGELNLHTLPCHVVAAGGGYSRSQPDTSAGLGNMTYI